MSEESETEQLLEVINSVDIKLKMFEAFPIWTEVYKVSKDDPAIFDLHAWNIQRQC
jgi:hypothetical protein